MKINIRLEGATLSQVAEAVNIALREDGWNRKVTENQLKTRIAAKKWKLAEIFTENEQKSIINMAFQELDSLRETVAEYSYSRRRYAQVDEEFPEDVILLEAPDAYWSYDESAEAIEKATQMPVYYGSKGVGVRFDKRELQYVQLCLINEGYGVHVDSPKLHIGFAINPFALPHAAVRRRVKVEVSSLVEVENEKGERFAWRIIAPPPPQPPKMIRGSNGWIEIPQALHIPDDCLNVESPVGNALLGHNVGDVVTVSIGGEEQRYTIRLVI